MIKINFKEFRLPLDVTKSTFRAGDARESMANLIYNNFNGIAAHALALKIFQSEGVTVYSQEEVALIKIATEKYASPAFIDGLNEQLNNQ